MVGSSRDIWCSYRETGRFHEKLPGKLGELAGMQTVQNRVIVRPLINVATYFDTELLVCL